MLQELHDGHVNDTYDSDTSSPSSPHTSTAGSGEEASGDIFLSDLLRTGEASRLRRRGAMRLDHMLRQGSSAGVGDGVDVTYSAWRVPGHLGSPGDEMEEESGGYSLWCGTEEQEDQEGAEDEWGSDEPWRPALLPSSPPPLPPSRPLPYSPYASGSSTRSSASDHHSRKRSSHSLAPHRTHNSSPRSRKNGCGALLHTDAAPRRGRVEWMGIGDPEGALAMLDPSYGRDPRQAKRYPCGCVWEYFGCRMW